MEDLSNYFRILFLNAELSNLELKEISESHLSLLAKNNSGGKYSVLLFDTFQKYCDFFGINENPKLKIAVEKALTIGMNESHQALIKYIRRQEGMVRGKYGRESLEYREVFPYGLNEYNVQAMMNFGELGNRFWNFVINHVDDFGIKIPNETTGFLNLYFENFAIQFNQLEALPKNSATPEAPKTVLCKQLTYNLLTIARDNLGTPESFSSILL